jgi:hypothetical protein
MPRLVAAPPPRRRKPRPPRRIECRHRRRRHRHAHGESDRRTRRGEEVEDASSPPRSPRGTTCRSSCGIGLARGVGLGMHSIMTKRRILASTIIGLMVLAGFGALTAHRMRTTRRRTYLLMIKARSRRTISIPYRPSRDSASTPLPSSRSSVRALLDLP